MQIVIDIPDKYMKGKKVENGSLACEYILEAVYNGAPLPKRIEHGIDGNLYEMSITNGKEYEEGNTDTDKAGEEE